MIQDLDQKVNNTRVLGSEPSTVLHVCMYCMYVYYAYVVVFYLWYIFLNLNITDASVLEDH